MNKELIDKIRRMLDFMEESAALISEARRNGDMEREEELYAILAGAEHGLRECVARLLGDHRGGAVPAAGGEPPF